MRYVVTSYEIHNRKARIGRLEKNKKRKRGTMKRIELESMSILELRKLAEKNKIKSTKKHAIIAALADDYRGGSAAPIATPAQPQIIEGGASIERGRGGTPAI